MRFFKEMKLVLFNREMEGLAMQILEHGMENKKVLLFFPCTAEPV